MDFTAQPTKRYLRQLLSNVWVYEDYPDWEEIENLFNIKSEIEAARKVFIEDLEKESSLEIEPQKERL